MTEQWDSVLTENEYYDGPRLGVATFNGVPHIYEAEFDHSSDDYGDTYFLAPISQELLSLVLEDWNIWLRWEEGYRKNLVTVETHPSLPAERPRHEELQKQIGDRLKVDRTLSVPVKAMFRHVPLDGKRIETQVKWIALDTTRR